MGWGLDWWLGLRGGDENMQITIEIEDSMIDKVMYILDRLKPDIKIIDRELLDIEPIDKNDKDYEYIIKGREERASSPQNYSSLEEF